MVELQKPITRKQLDVLMVLTDLEYHSSNELHHLCGATPVRDIIKGLRTTHGLLIHGRGSWRLDDRHVNGDSQSDLIARAEAKVKHGNNSVALAKRESKRLPKAIVNSQAVNDQLKDIKNKTH